TREEGQLVQRADLDFTLLEGDALGPGNGFVQRFRPDQTVAGDQLLRFREGTVGHLEPSPGVADPRPLSPRLQPLSPDPPAGLDQFLSPIGKVRHHLFVGQPARLEVPGGLDQQDEAHRWVPLPVAVLFAAAISAGASAPVRLCTSKATFGGGQNRLTDGEKRKGRHQEGEIGSLRHRQDLANCGSLKRLATYNRYSFSAALTEIWQGTRFARLGSVRVTALYRPEW